LRAIGPPAGGFRGAAIFHDRLLLHPPAGGRDIAMTVSDFSLIALHKEGFMVGLFLY